MSSSSFCPSRTSGEPAGALVALSKGDLQPTSLEQMEEIFEVHLMTKGLGMLSVQHSPSAHGNPRVCILWGHVLNIRYI